ncbi:MAG: hypothetical protein Faunusvirus2_30 [Faunusvirus sp.]|jgi:ankyrin repeat protein|uniref:Uncharacterized protein n=1 Tax=Faunusvirus sp. TaxID=2487766 RepID=A0A3G4ZZS9_9VIRU|nr:MAG: hypothetical protein Faunusvirus2_30 [Faunusvirus sp.]
MTAIARNHAHTFIDLLYNDVDPINETAAIKYIDEYNDFYNTKINPWWSPLTYACNYGHEQVAFKLMDVGADINLITDKWTPLMFACYKSNVKIALELIRRGANINVKTNDKNSAIILSCVKRNQSMVIMLIDAGAEFVDIIDNHIIGYYNRKVMKYIRDKYRLCILAVIDAEHTDTTVDNAMAACFRTTYAVELIDIISEFII